MGLAETTIGKALLGDEDNAVIKSGTLAVTRGAGVVAAAVIAAAQLEWPFDDLTSVQKLTAALVAVGIWAFLAAADAIARGYATANTDYQLRVLPTPLPAKIPERQADDETGWRVYMLRLKAEAPDQIEYWVVKENEALWIGADKVRLLAEQTAPRPRGRGLRGGGARVPRRG